MRAHLRLSKEVADALQRRLPVVALESTLVTHGLPHPGGIEAAAALEAEVRAGGAVPATIGVLDRALCVGLSAGELERLAIAPAVEKLNPGNLAAGIASGAPGSTTVAATMLAAAHAGIAVFATGGIGGVHRDVEKHLDLSADLAALARYRVAVVCAGAKAVLDLPKTIEVLETLGVPVLGHGTDTFPAFYRRNSGLAVDRRCDTADALADIVRTHFELAAGGVVVANPIAAADEMPRALYDASLARALADAEKEGVRGRAVTPFLLERMRALTEGQSVFSNLSLLRNNARLATALARALRRRED